MNLNLVIQQQNFKKKTKKDTWIKILLLLFRPSLGSLRFISNLDSTASALQVNSPYTWSSFLSSTRFHKTSNETSTTIIL